MTRKNIYQAPDSYYTKHKPVKEAYYHVRIVKYTKHTTWSGKQPIDEWLPTSQNEFHCDNAQNVLEMVQNSLK